MKKPFFLLFSGILITYLAIQLRLDIFIILTGISLSAVAITYGYLILIKRQYERLSIQGKLYNESLESSTRPAA